MPQRSRDHHTSTAVSLLDALRDPSLFGGLFTASSWRAWVCCAATVFGLTDELNAEDRALVARCLNRHTLPRSLAREAWLVIGRRGGKSRFAALTAVFLACFRDYRTILAPGERGVLMIIAADRRQARVVKRYTSGLLQAVPMLADLVVRETRDAIELSHRVTIEIHTASYRAIRGYTVVGAICDEIAFWRTEDSDPDTEILNALRPAMATVAGALLLCISSPYARRGELWKAYRSHYSQDDSPVLVWQADTRTMNRTISQEVIDHAYADDEAVASAEYGAQFRRDLESFVSREAVEAVTVPGRHELPPMSGWAYVAFCDPAGGSGSDSMTLAVAHLELKGEQRINVLDAIREARPPFSPDAVVQEFAEVLRAYRIACVTGDRYGGEWPRERFRVHGIDYALAEQTKSELYAAVLPAINSHRVELLDSPRLRTQLAALERRTGRTGRDSVDSPPSARDDVANAVSGALGLADQDGAWYVRDSRTGQLVRDYGITVAVLLAVGSICHIVNAVLTVI